MDNLLLFPTDCNFSMACPNKQEATKVLDYYGAANSLNPAHLFTIDKRRKKHTVVGSTIFHTNAPLRSIITAASREQRKLRLVSLGGQLMTVDNRRMAAHRYRLSQDGLHHVAQLLAQRRVPLSVTELRQLLQLSHASAHLPLDRLSESSREALQAMNYGQCIVSCSLADGSKISLVAFASNRTIELIVKEHVRQYYLFLIGEDNSSGDSPGVTTGAKDATVELCKL